MPPLIPEKHFSGSVSSMRKSYVAPIVVEYGKLVDITLTITGAGNSDGGGSQSNGKNRTHL